MSVHRPKIILAEYVFRAQLTSAVLIERAAEGHGRVKARFDIIAQLKGDPTELDGVTTPIGNTACPLLFSLQGT